MVLSSVTRSPCPSIGITTGPRCIAITVSCAITFHHGTRIRTAFSGVRNTRRSMSAATSCTTRRNTGGGAAFIATSSSWLEKTRSTFNSPKCSESRSSSEADTLRRRHKCCPTAGQFPDDLRWMGKRASQAVHLHANNRIEAMMPYPFHHLVQPFPARFRSADDVRELGLRPFSEN